MLALSVTVGLVLLSTRAPSRQVIKCIDLGVLVLLAALAGARVGYVGLNWAYFAQRPQEILQVWLGGLSGLGAVYGFLAGLLLVAYLVEEPLTQLADTLLPLGFALVVGSWLAAWQAGSAYGFVLPNGASIPAQDEAGIWAPRFPTQPIGALLSLALWIFLDRLYQKASRQERVIPGRIASLAVLGIAVTLLGLSFTRADPLPLWHSLRLDTWAAMGLVLLGLMACGGVEVGWRRFQNRQA
jgi:phosphatidylglycerol---prolipoprotein diacylglyceryl transferase